jgi:hypothetical protein
MFLRHILLAVDGPLDSAPDPTESAVAAQQDLERFAQEVTNVLFPGNNPSSTADSVPKALNTLWHIAMDGNMYHVVCIIGMFIAIVAVGFWCIKFYKTLEEGGIRPAMNELVMPVVVVIMLSNGGKNMKNLTMGTRAMMNGFNQSVNTVINDEVSFRTAIAVIANTDAAREQVNRIFATCQKLTKIEEYSACISRHRSAANLVVRGATGSWATSNGTQWQTEVGKWTQKLEDSTTNLFALTNLNDLQEDSLDLSKINSYTDTDDVRRVILSFRGAFLYIIEVMMLVTGLTGPIFLALSLFPTSNKPVVTWITSFLSMGFCKICFSLISGLSAVAMVYAGYDNVDMLVAAVVLGLLAPVLSFSIATGSGLGALTTIAYSAQSFKMNAGISTYTPGTGQGDKNDIPV